MPFSLIVFLLPSVSVGLVATRVRGKRPTALGVTASPRLGTTHAPSVSALNASVATMRQFTAVDLSDDELAWFVRDRRGNVEAAAAKAEQYYEWRRRGWGGLAADRASLKSLAARESTKCVGYLADTKDVLGRPVVVVVARRHSVMSRSLRESQALCIDVLESAMDQLKSDRREQFAAIVDLRGAGSGAVDIQFLIWLVSTLRNFYPKRLGLIALVDPPKIIFQAAWSLIQPYMGKHAALVRLVTAAEVRNHYFPAGELPSDLW